MDKTIQDYSYTPPAPKQFPWRPVVAVLAVVLVVAGVLVWYFKFRETTIKQGEQTVSTAKPGRIISGFPSDMIPEKGVDVQTSYSIGVGGATQPVVTYMSDMSIADNVKAYKNYFEANGWQILTDGGNLASPFIYAVTPKYKQEANVVLSEVGGKVKVTVSILNNPSAPANEQLF